MLVLDRLASERKLAGGKGGKERDFLEVLSLT